MISKVIGIGAAGNKAAISAIQAKVIGTEDVLLVNSTLKDIPHDYEGEKYCFNEAYGGCGKERNIAKEYMTKDLQSKHLDIKKFLQIGVENKQAELVVIVSSTEGGTGSGSAPILAKYIRHVLGINVRCTGFLGFEDDIRGLRNSIEYVNEMEDEIATELISNMKCMDEANGDKIKAEKLANAEFCKKLAVLLGNLLRDSDHNIDPTDLLKVATTPNYSMIEYREFDKIKNKKEFKDMVQAMIDESKSTDLDVPSQKRLAVMINIDENATGAIDYADVLTSTFGEIFERFEHIEHEKSLPQFFAFISSGNKMPVKEIEDIYEAYKLRASNMDKSPDEFYAKSFEFDDQEDKFNLVKKKNTMSEDAFFGTIEKEKSGNKESNGRSDILDTY